MPTEMVLKWCILAESFFFFGILLVRRWDKTARRSAADPRSGQSPTLGPKNTRTHIKIEPTLCRCTG